jgi:hypothetical protein
MFTMSLRTWEPQSEALKVQPRDVVVLESHSEAQNAFLEFLRLTWSIRGSPGALKARLEPQRLAWSLRGLPGDS